MRCEEVIRELAVPTAGRDELAISRHLAGCEACSRWAEQAAEFDRLWDATRPVEPSAEAWDNLWSSVTAQLDQPAPANRQWHALDPLSRTALGGLAGSFGPRPLLARPGGGRDHRPGSGGGPADRRRHRLA